MHALGLFLMKAGLILLTPVLLVAGTVLAWKFSLWLLKRSIKQFDDWLSSP